MDLTFYRCLDCLHEAVDQLDDSRRRLKMRKLLIEAQKAVDDNFVPVDEVMDYINDNPPDSGL